MPLPHGSIRMLTQLAAAWPSSSSTGGPPLRGLCLLGTASDLASSSSSCCPSAPFPAWGSLRTLCTASAPPRATPAGSTAEASVLQAVYDAPSGGAPSTSAVAVAAVAGAAAADPPFRWAVDRRAALEGRLPDNLPAPLDHSVKQVRYSTVHRFSKVPLADAHFVL